ncbi:putative immediate-early protein [Neofusicoccum parvum UCRNP2]|uniref:Putative immediate-early protein n=1 Tax=Botryosphaeria parva (strain UCR-NP2) TaxID=1287680 RepID=R1EWY4_BOTPV|nr:putative immediate-early protein [Neofusicoccum parvum UCRNP2]
MFSRALDNARALLSRSPSRSALRDQQDCAPSPAADAMVTTRGGADTNSPAASSATRSGRKRFIDDSAQATPTRTTKKRRSSADEQDEATPKLDFGKDSAASASASDSAQDTQEPALSVSTPIRGRGRGRPRKDAAPETPVAGNKGQKPEQETTDDTPRAPDATPQDDESVYGTPAGDDTPASVSTPSKPSRLASSQTIDEDMDISTPKAEEPKPEESAPAPENTHIRFGSEDPPTIPEPPAEPPAQQEIPSSTAEQEEDSDDEAPEAVTATSAREQARAAEEDAAKAIEKQESEAKRKRQDREARLREQATAAKKRKQEQAPPPPPPTEIPADVASSTTIQASDPSALHKRTTKPAYDLNNIPALLPADLLAAAPDVRPATPEPEEAGSVQADAAARKKEKLNKHLKFLDEKPAKDVKKGPVKVRVLEKGNKFLPPKVMSNGSKSVRDTWLQGRKIKETRKGSFGGLERKKVGGGFLRK